jgi:hypothetical protein
VGLVSLIQELEVLIRHTGECRHFAKSYFLALSMFHARQIAVKNYGEYQKRVESDLFAFAR